MGTSIMQMKRPISSSFWMIPSSYISTVVLIDSNHVFRTANIIFRFKDIRLYFRINDFPAEYTRLAFFLRSKRTKKEHTQMKSLTYFKSFANFRLNTCCRVKNVLYFSSFYSSNFYTINCHKTPYLYSFVIK